MGASSLTSTGIQWLTAEQAVADYAAALRFVRQASVLQQLELFAIAMAHWTLDG